MKQNPVFSENLKNNWIINMNIFLQTWLRKFVFEISTEFLY